MINDIEEYIDPALEQGSERIRRSNTDRERKKDIKHRERHSARKQSTKNEEAGETHRCRVVASEGANFIVRNEAHVESRARTIKSTHSGNSNATLVVVGDEVIIAPGENDISIIREILPRKTKLSRRAHKRRDSFEQVIASNIDILAIVMSAGDPPFQNGI